MKEEIPDEFLNAFVDGELTGSELEKALYLMRTDPGFQRNVCELRNLKELVYSTYALPSVPKQGARLKWMPLWQHALAASVLLATGLGGGWLLRGEADNALPMASQPIAIPASYQAVAYKGQDDSSPVVLHLDSSDLGRFNSVLDLAEKLARQTPQSQVEVLVNSYGLDLLRQDISPYAVRIGHLAETYGNLKFVACGQTVARFKSEGADVRLLPKVVVTPNVISEIVDRMQHGWRYMKM